jgi:SAM-dependent methyltransferase
MDDLGAAGGFESSYLGPPPPWDIGRAQPAVVALAAQGLVVGPVLDAGCGSGENALYLAGLGRGLVTTFILGDALRLAELGRTFETVIDSGLFHVFPDRERARYVAALSAVVGVGGRVHIICFSEREPGTWGPRRVTEAELRAAFAAGWRVEAIVPERFITNGTERPVEAWLASIARL